jgi:hypothetical protein
MSEMHEIASKMDSIELGAWWRVNRPLFGGFFGPFEVKCRGEGWLPKFRRRSGRAKVALSDRRQGQKVPFRPGSLGENALRSQNALTSVKTR